MKSILLVKKFLGLVETTSGLINASFSLPEWQAVKMISLHPVKPLINFADVTVIIIIFLPGNISRLDWWRKRSSGGFFLERRIRARYNWYTSLEQALH